MGPSCWYPWSSVRWREYWVIAEAREAVSASAGDHDSCYKLLFDVKAVTTNCSPFGVVAT
jgi:hypothetical protein